MFKIYDGRKEFYQWDLNRKLIVEDKLINEVHFSNRTTDYSLITEVYELDGLRVADVPNILLQESWDIKVYAYDSEYTKHCETYNVIARTRPDDYVYTETEQRKWEHLEARIDNIEQNGIPEEAIRNAVEKYLNENSIHIDLTGYATETYVDNALAAIVIPNVAISLASGTTITDADVHTELVDIFNNGMSKAVFINGNQMVSYKTSGALSTGATINFYGFKPTANTENKVTTTVYQVTIKSASVEISSAMTGYISGLATEKYVNDAIAAINIPEVDLSNYYTKTETDSAINAAKPDLSGYALKTEIPDVSNLATKDEIPSTTGLATETYVDNAIAAIDIPQPDLSGYQEKLTAGDNITIEGNVISATGGSGGSVEEVYIGNTEPTDASYKLWINPEEEGGSVKVDGTTIVKSLDGTISATIGGGKTLAAEPVVVAEYKGNGFTTISSSNDRYASNMSDFLSNLDKNVTYTVELGFRNVNTGTDGSCVGTITYDITFSNLYPWKADGLAVFDDTIIGLGYSTSQGVFLLGGNSKKAYGTYYINTFRVLTPVKYTYNKIDSGYIKTGAGLKVNGYDELVTTLGGLEMVDELHLIMTNGNNQLHSTKTYNVALGKNNYIGMYSDTGIAIGGDNTVSPTSGYGYVAIGRENVISGNGSAYGAAAVGYSNRVDAKMAVAMGCGAYAIGESQTVYGKWNLVDSTYTVIIGNGTDKNNRANGLTMDSSGNIVTQGTISNGGADYAEYFEWEDGNEGNEDRIGLIVTLEGNKIRLAQAGDDILGVVSGTATVLGDDAEWHWHGKYLRDEFGRVQTKIIQLYDDEDNPDGYATVPVVNPEYDEKQHYVPRSERAAWDVIGMMGKLYVRDDGSCVVGGYAAVAADGLASFSTGRTNMRVMERISDSVVRVLLK